jgi:hypothetical protein
MSYPALTLVLLLLDSGNRDRIERNKFWQSRGASRRIPVGVRGVCSELLFKPRLAIGTGLCSDFGSGKNLELQLWVVSS